MAADVLVVKIGGSLVSDKASEGHLDHEVLEGYAKLVADLHRCAPGRIVLVAGGGSIGHGAVRNLVPDDPLAVLPLTEATFRVKWHWIRALRRHGVPCLPLQTAAIVSFGARVGPDVQGLVLERLLSHGMLPVLSGDCVVTGDGSLRIFSSDEVPAAVVRSVPGRVRVAVLTDVHGLLADGPEGDEVVPEVDADSPAAAFAHIWPAADHDTSGAMAGKLTALVGHALQGAECFILRGDHTAAGLDFLLRPVSEWPSDVRYTRIASRRTEGVAP
jgi:isopentenyl phosphate kinase